MKADQMEKTTVLNVVRQGARRLSIAKISDAVSTAESFMSHLLGKSRTQLYLDSDQLLSESETIRFLDFVDRRLARVPAQYLIGSIPFRNTELRVTPLVLIPRFETETLIDVVLERIGECGVTAPHILEAGTGSGCIAVSLAQELPGCRVVATDIFEEALLVARQNAAENGVSQRVSFVRTDLWAGLSARFNVIVSNPPYLSQADFGSLQPEIRFEPRQALDGGQDGLDFYRRIIGKARASLTCDGLIVFEVGATQADRVASLLKKHGFSQIRLTKDLLGVRRVVSAVASNLTE